MQHQSGPLFFFVQPVTPNIPYEIDHKNTHDSFKPPSVVNQCSGIWRRRRFLMHVQERSCDHGYCKNNEKNRCKSGRKKNVGKYFLHRLGIYDFSRCKVRVLKPVKTLKNKLTSRLSCLKNIKVQKCSHLSGSVFGVIGYFAFKKRINGFVPQIQPYPKMVFGDGVIVLFIYFYMNLQRIARILSIKKQGRLPEIRKLFNMSLPICNYSVEKRPQKVIFSYFFVEFRDQKVDFFSGRNTDF